MGGVPLSNRYEKFPTNSRMVDHVGSKGKGLAFNVADPILTFSYPSDNKSTKSGWKIKKRRHDEGPTVQPTPAGTTKVKLADPNPLNNEKKSPRR